MLPEMGRQLDENVLGLRSHFKTDLFGDLFVREIVSLRGSGAAASVLGTQNRGFAGSGGGAPSPEPSDKVFVMLWLCWGYALAADTIHPRSPGKIGEGCYLIH